jgi:quercetin dioxygenase-like cupin family protein
MIIRLSLALVLALVFAGAAPVGAQQDDTKAPKGFKTRNLVTSLGGFTATVNAPILVTGSQIELEPGGHSGRHQFRVPTFVYVIEGILTSEYEAGPVGIAGAQYHAAGQSFMDNGGWWHNYFNRTDKPVKVLILHLGYPGRPDPIQRPDAE